MARHQATVTILKIEKYKTMLQPVVMSGCETRFMTENAKYTEEEDSEEGTWSGRALRQWSSTWGMRRHLKGYEKTSYRVCKIKKKNFMINIE
jgi:hypothetical protein